jgi:hypothetical protein
MDPRDDLDSLAGGVDCAACGELVPADRVRVLARRDDLAFVEIACPGCRSDSLGIVFRADAAAEPSPVGPGRRFGEWGPRDEARFRESLPIDDTDLDRVRGLLARGGLAALVGGPEGPPTGSSR